MDSRQINILKEYPQRIFNKRENIISQNTSADYVFYLSHGICTRNMLTEKGDEIIYDMRSADDSVYCLLGALSLYLPETLHLTNFTAKTRCICYQIPAKDFLDFLSANPSIMHELLALAVNRYNFLNKNFQSKQKQSTANRVCCLLTENLHEKDNSYYLKEYLTNSEISRYLGCHRVTVVKIMRQLASEGVIERTPEGLLVKNINQLLTYARDEDTLRYT